MVLDELTTGLDPAARRDTWDAIATLRDRDVTTVLVTHFVDEAEYLCDRVAILQDGRIAALGSPSQLVARGTTTRIRIRTSDTLEVAAFERLPGVEKAFPVNEGLEVIGRTANLAFAVSTQLAAQGIDPDAFEVQSDGLEDIMRQLPGTESIEDLR